MLISLFQLIFLIVAMNLNKPMNFTHLIYILDDNHLFTLLLFIYLIKKDKKLIYTEMMLLESNLK